MGTLSVWLGDSTEYSTKNCLLTYLSDELVLLIDMPVIYLSRIVCCIGAEIFSFVTRSIA